MSLSRILCPALIGRGAELSILEDALLSAVRGDGGVVIVGGEAGMGKTRLVNELTGRAQRLRCVVMAGACSEAELSLPYLPFLEAIGNRLTTDNVAEVRQRLGSAAAELAQLFPQLGRAPAAGADLMQAKLRLFEAILLFLRDAARDRALLLILEDLQWADPATRELLDYMTRRLRKTNVLILATYRMDEMHRKHPLVPTIQGWRRSGQAEFIELKPLPAEAVADMVCKIFDESELSREFRDFLHERSEGNPFVLEEMLRDALDRGDIFRTETGWDRKAVSEMRIPRTVRDTILHRLERLSPMELEILSAASVVGRSFDLAILAAATAADEGVVLSAVETCVTFQLLEEDDRASGRYRFRHALTREAVYEDLIRPRREQLHSRVADVLESHPDRAAVDLAHHLLMAGRYEQAVGICVQAAEDALRAHAYSDAAALFERATPHVHDPAERARLLCRAGDSYWNNTDPAAARRLLEEGITILEGAGFGPEAAGHRLMLGRCLWELQRSDLARAQFNQARDVLEKAGPSEQLAIAYIRLSGMDTFEIGGPAGLEDARRAEAIARQVGSTMALGWSWGFMALPEIGLGDMKGGFKHLEESYLALREGDYPFQTGNAIYNAAWLAINLGLGREAQKWGERAAGVPERNVVWPNYIEGLVTLYAGRVDEALKMARTAVQLGNDVSHAKMQWRARVLLAHALAENLRPEDAAAELPSLSSRVDGQDTVYDTMSRVRVKLANGDPAGALHAARTVAPELTDLGSPADAVAEAASSDPAWLRSFLGHVRARGEVLSSPRLSAARGRLALYEGRLDEALVELRSAVAAFEEGGLLLDVWHVGRALAATEARSGDTEGARKRLDSIASAAESNGARLAAMLARDTASSLGLHVAQAPEADGAPAPKDRVAVGERMVSVLFADVRGYSEMSGQMPPAEMLDRIASLQRWASQEVAKRHGMVDKFAGDAVMATFNVSGQTVDHTLQALQAAIAIIDKAALAGVPVGAGIAVGPAVVGTLAEAANVSVLGEVTNLAARLQAHSGGGEVTLTEEARRRVGNWLEQKQMQTERLELQLKGFEKPVIAFRVVTAAVARNAT
ncbi:MAG: AAA family ATPase [Candidatus Dormibacteraeota bacterium]|nr:AAA family ATPase [Candidatus Dormibacteraeota bacterium]